MILTVIPCHLDDCIRAEKLLDHILNLNKKKQHESGVLLVFAPSVPQENRDKLRITAEVTFKHVVTASPRIEPNDDKRQIVASMLRSAALNVSSSFRVPWLWLEPDCTPLKSSWLKDISTAYESQPMKYMGGHLKYGEAIALNRIAVYPNDATNDFKESQAADIPFEFFVVNKSSKSRLFQEAKIVETSDIGVVRPDALIVHKDKTGVLHDEILKRERDAKPQTKTASTKTTNSAVNKTSTTQPAV